MLMSSEDLVRHLPGRRGITRYHGTARALSATADNAGYRFRAALDLTVYLSMRKANAWRRSTGWQNRRSTRLTEDLDGDAVRHAAAALDELVAEMAVARCSPTRPWPLRTRPAGRWRRGR
ncbi:hypothetical protein GCM10011415_17480 [Salipiger pallidus]|uniref:Uncharacterized protein n=1 Tax=Salipiger pallidus TaxID=1775170 RepID=A0A8J2ZJ86_9RHOB|nr:hypothetical protein [Salipiger pallidus]GGG70395.1 hypothetical protein GCM10011415_17480 [Salipiger pallidus]